MAFASEKAIELASKFVDQARAMIGNNPELLKDRGFMSKVNAALKLTENSLQPIFPKASPISSAVESVKGLLGNAGNAVMNGVRTVGAQNYADFSGNGGDARLINTLAQGSPDNELFRAATKLPMSIPALGGALGTGMLMAGAAGGAMGIAADWATYEFLKTQHEQTKAKASMDLAKAVEKAQRVNY